MTAPARQFAVYPGGQPGRSAPPGREYLELWFRLARIPWASVVLVPADAGTSVAEVATSLAEVGSSLRETPITAIVAESMDYGSARALAELQPRLTSGAAWKTTVEVEARPVDPEQSEPPHHAATLLSPMGRAIISIQPVVDEPLGLAIAQAADAVVLCIEVGKTRLGAARRTMELIGPERIIGAFLVR
jgi:hypothetical protein